MHWCTFIATNGEIHRWRMICFSLLGKVWYDFGVCVYNIEAELICESPRPVNCAILRVNGATLGNRRPQPISFNCRKKRTNNNIPRWYPLPVILGRQYKDPSRDLDTHLQRRLL